MLSFGSTSPVSITGTAGTANLTISTTAATSGALRYPARPGVRWYTAGGTTLAFAHGERQARYDLTDVLTTAKPTASRAAVLI